MLWAYEFGPDPGYSGVPLEHGGATCATAGCHTGTANNPANKGSVTVAFPNGLTYVPGVKQHLTVTIADPAVTQQAWGFQLTARVSGTPSAMAGFFAFTDANTLLMCSQPNFVVLQAQCQNAKSDGCANHHQPPALSAIPCSTSSTASQATPLPKVPAREAISSIGRRRPRNVGNVVIYVAANAGPPGPAYPG